MTLHLLQAQLTWQVIRADIFSPNTSYYAINLETECSRQQEASEGVHLGPGGQDDR